MGLDRVSCFATTIERQQEVPPPCPKKTVEGVSVGGRTHVPGAATFCHDCCDVERYWPPTMSDNLSDIPARREHSGSHNAHSSLPGAAETGTAAIWLAIYFLTAVLCAAGAVLVARAVRATGMEIVAAGGGAFLAVLGLAITVHRFLRDR